MGGILWKKFRIEKRFLFPNPICLEIWWTHCWKAQLGMGGILRKKLRIASLMVYVFQKTTG